MKHSLLLSLGAALACQGTYAADATLELGQYSTTSEILEGSTPERGFPFNYMYTYSGGQILYPSALLEEITSRNGEIKSITFRYRENGTFYDGDLEGSSTVWCAASDLQTIPTDDKGKSAWLPYADGQSATASIDYSITYGENEFEVTYTFARPVAMAPGKSLLVTASSEETNGLYTSMYDFDCFGFRVSDETGKKFASYFGSDTKSFQEDYEAANLNSWNSQWAPVVKIEYSYVDKLPVAEAPVFSPESGTALGPDDKVTITAAEGASILYTLEKDATPDLPYTGPIALDKDATVTAIATMEGHDPSEPVSASYTLKISAAPEFAIPSGTLLGANEKVTITAPEGSEILYTLTEGATPDLPYNGPITLDGDATVTAIATVPGSYPSKAVTASYSVSDLEATVIGDYYAVPDASNTFIGTNWYNAPIIPTYANSASQMLYLPGELEGFNDKTRIRSVAFRFTNETCFSDYSSTARLYIQAVDEDAFPYDNLNSKYRWFPVELDAPLLTMPVEIPFVDYYYGCGELTFILPEAFRFPAGKSLLLTVVNEAATPLDNSEYPQFLKYDTDARRTATFASDHCDYAASLAVSDYVANGEGYYSSMTDNNQPCVKIFTDNLGIDAISAVESADDASAPAYYNLQGIRVRGDLAPGIYILRTAGRTSKVLVK